MQSTKRISEANAAILVKDSSLKGNSYAEFYTYLKNEGFTLWKYSKGYYEGIDWVFINIKSKAYAKGMPGVAITKVFCEHAVTIEEFKIIYEIFKKYEGKAVLEM